MEGMPDIGIRTATDGDERALAAIDYATWSTQVSPAPLWPRNPRSSTIGQHRRTFCSHTKATTVLGYVKLRPSPMSASSGHVQEINGFAVCPNHQGRGIGHLLLDAARIKVIDRRARRITLRVLETNTRAQSLYLAHGYRIEGRLVGQFLIQDSYVDDVLMALRMD